MPRKIRGTIFNLNLWSSKSDSKTPARESTSSCLRPTTADAAHAESGKEAVFGGQLIADFKVSIGDLAGEDRFDAGIEQ
jgi:hypothetical protein